MARERKIVLPEHLPKFTRVCSRETNRLKLRSARIPRSSLCPVEPDSGGQCGTIRVPMTRFHESLQGLPSKLGQPERGVPVCAMCLGVKTTQPDSGDNVESHPRAWHVFTRPLQCPSLAVKFTNPVGAKVAVPLRAHPLRFLQGSTPPRWSPLHGHLNKVQREVARQCCLAQLLLFLALLHLWAAALVREESQTTVPSVVFLLTRTRYPEHTSSSSEEVPQKNRFPPRLENSFRAKDAIQRPPGQTRGEFVPPLSTSVGVKSRFDPWVKRSAFLVPSVQPCRPRLRRSAHAAKYPRYLSRVSARRSDSTIISRGLTSREVVII